MKIWQREGEGPCTAAQVPPTPRQCHPTDPGGSGYLVGLGKSLQELLHVWARLHVDLGGNSLLENHQHPQPGTKVTPKRGSVPLATLTNGISGPLPLQLQGTLAQRPHGMAVKSHTIHGPKPQLPSTPRLNTHCPHPEAPTL